MSWEELLEIERDQRHELAEERRRRPTACPNDGEPLLVDSENRLHCPFDGWTEDEALRV